MDRLLPGDVHPISTVSPMPRWALSILLAVAVWFFITHLWHVFAEVINWDEFAILERADRTLRFGKVVGDGRPGLITIVLVPFVKGCIDSARSVVNARLLWLLVTVIYLAGVYQLVRAWFVHVGRPAEGHVQGLLAVSLLAFIPAFVVWSVQVRTDQAALAAAVWGGVFLLSESHRRSAFAGGLFALAVLCTQKGIYTIGLCLALYATATFARAWPVSAATRCELVLAVQRLGVAAVSAIAVLGIYTLLVPEATRVASGGSVALSLETMELSRASQGFRIYTVHAHRLIVHWLLLAALVSWTIRAALNREGSDVALLANSWLLLLLGLIVILFHGSSFPYFIMTAGLFPALALAMTCGRPLALAGRATWPVVVSLVLLAALQSATESIEMLVDTQREQRETLRLVYASPLTKRRGYHVEGALLCTRDPEPLQTMFSPDIWRKFTRSPQAAKNISDFISSFRDRPIAYIVESYRLAQFPAPIRAFFSQHYIWYARSLYIAGYNVRGSRGIDVIVPGSYRWDAEGSQNLSGLRVDDVILEPGDLVDLQVGAYQVTATATDGRGQLILADLPQPHRIGYPAFYHRRQIAQLGGFR